VKIAFTANGPGELAGWFRPLVRRLYERDPSLDVHLFCVPDDYATGYEAELARRLFPSAHVYDPKAYLRFALGRADGGMPERVDVVQYLGGDLMHALRLSRRLKATATSYKFSKRAYRARFARVFAVDAKNVEQLRGWQTPEDRIAVVGNLAIDGALLGAQQPLEPGAPEGGLLIMPGSRGYEVEHLIPFFFTMALRIRREAPGLPIAFGISPFTPMADVRTAIERGGHPRVFAQRGRVLEEGDRVFLAGDDGTRIPVLRNALAAATRSRMVVTIPGTKCIELAVLGVPMIAMTPLNAPEVVTFNGPLTYLDRVPLVGIPLKRAVAVGVSRRFIYHTQPNIDAQAMLVHELHGTLTPGRVARVALERISDEAWLARSGEALAALYRDHVGAADRMAESLLQLSCVSPS
jgi:lipid-A-disaccharide synthase